MTEEDVKALRTAIMTGTDAPSWLDGMLRRNAVRSWNVMAITFTNKAAGELKERLRRMLGGTVAKMEQLFFPQPEPQHQRSYLSGAAGTGARRTHRAGRPGSADHAPHPPGTQ